MNFAYKITAKIQFPQGAAPGAGTRSNRKVVARNGRGDIVLRGSALAGVLRRAYAERVGTKPKDKSVCRWFGSKQDGDVENESAVRIADAVLNSNALGERTHNMVNRHTGAVFTGAMLSLEAIPPGAGTLLSITLKPSVGNTQDYKEFISHLAAILGQGGVVGGSSNRGIGRMTLGGDIHLREFDLSTVKGTADFLDAEYREKKTGIELEGETLPVPESADDLEVSLELGIPRGEDLLVGDGQEADYALKPQSVYFADGSTHWRIPGSSLRGVFRNWMTRLAARDKEMINQGKKVIDSVEKWYEQDGANEQQHYKPHLIGWGFIEDEKKRKEYQKTPGELNDPILDLFGSMYKKGRIHISDSFTEILKDDEAQDRMHVAVDRFSGGANEGALFLNQVLTGDRLRFPVTITVKKPMEKEIQWLVKTLRALHLGILHVGSSKGGGRLEIKTISAKGAGHDAIIDFGKELN